MATGIPAKSIFGTPPSEVAINWTPHIGNQEVTAAIAENFKSPTPAMIVEIIASRGWGKTLWTMCQVVAPYLNQSQNAKVMWVAPSYQVGMAPIEDVLRGTNQDTGEFWIPERCPLGHSVWQFSVTASGPLLKWWTGSTMAIKSADSPDSIVSRGYNLIVIDEAALIEERVFTQQILGTARKAGIKVIMITSPRGRRHWTHKIFLKGQDKSETRYLSLQQPYTKNPLFNKDLAQLIRDLPEWLYRQEYLAEFVDDGSSVIRNLESVLEGPELNFEDAQQEWEAPLIDLAFKDQSGEERLIRAGSRRFVAGLDIAKQVDYTVLWVMDLDSGQCVYYRRMNKVDYREVIEHVAAVCKRFNHCDLVYDATGVGTAIGDFLNNFDLNAVPFTFTNESKNDLINKLIIAIEYGEIRIPNISTVKKELSAFSYTLTKTGKISYAAPEGSHDDIVIAIALANWYRKEDTGGTDIRVLEDIMNINAPRAQRESFVDWMHRDND